MNPHPHDPHDPHEPHEPHPHESLALTASDSTSLAHAAWPADRFYWALLDAPGLELHGPLPDSLRDELQDAVPVPVDTLHAVVAPHRTELGSGTQGLVVCAATREAISSLPPHTRSLTPSALPEFLAGTSALDPSTLNLLAGEYEPAPVRAQRTRRRRVVAATLVGLAILACVGLLRRASAWNAAAEDLRTAHARLLADAATVLPAAATDPFALTREIERLRRQTQPSTLPIEPPDAGVALASLLRAWPTDIDAVPRSLGVRPGSITLTVELAGDAKPFLDAFSAPTGWTLQEPRVSTVRGLTTLNLQLTCDTPSARPVTPRVGAGALGSRGGGA